jgi:hypothetical protein
MPIEVVSEFLNDREEYYRLLESREPYLYPGRGSDFMVCSNIFRENHLEGRLLAPLNRNAPFEPGDPNINGLLELSSHLSGYVGKVLIKTADDTIIKKQQDPPHTLIKDLIANTKEIAEKTVSTILSSTGGLGELNWRIDNSFSVVVFYLPDERAFEHAALYLCRHLEMDLPESCAVTYGGRIVWVINAPDSQKNGQDSFLKLIPLIIREFNCKAGIADPFHNFVELHSAYVQAAAALRLGQQRDPHLFSYHFSAYTLDYVIDRIPGELPEERFCHPGIITLKDHDKKHGTNFLKTLRYYLEARCNMALAAERHSLHRTTLNRRMERIAEITGIDLENTDELLHLTISLKLLSRREGK